MKQEVKPAYQPPTTETCLFILGHDPSERPDPEMETMIQILALSGVWFRVVKPHEILDRSKIEMMKLEVAFDHIYKHFFFINCGCDEVFHTHRIDRTLTFIDSEPERRDPATLGLEILDILEQMRPRFSAETRRWVELVGAYVFSQNHLTFTDRISAIDALGVTSDEMVRLEAFINKFETTTK